MEPKKVLANLKAREAELVARFIGKRKRAKDPATRGIELRRLKNVSRYPPTAKAVEAVAQATPEKSVPEGIPLQDVRDKGLRVGGPNGAVVSRPGVAK